MVEHAQQRWPGSEELLELLMDVKYGRPYYYELAKLLFNDLVDPEAYHLESPTAGDILRCNMCFSEWLLFDFDLGDGNTALRQAALTDPSLKEFADTQFYSLFWVLDQNWKTSTSRLRDTITHQDFLVHDTALARNTHWSTGMLGSRIARVESQWRLAGQVHLHDNAPACPEPKAPEGDGLGFQDQLAFITHVEQVIGHEGVYRESLKDELIYDSAGD